MAEPKSAVESLLIPSEEVKAAKPWSPAPFTGAVPTRAGRAREQAQAERDREARHVEAERVRATQEGFAAGFADGRALAEHEANRIAQVALAMETALAGLEQNVANHLLGLAIDLARAVVRREISSTPDALLALVQDALRALTESSTTGEIQVNPADADLVKDYLQASGYAGSWRILGDVRIEPGGCRIATRSCDIDATLETRWRRAMQTLGRTDAWNGETTAAAR